VTGTSAAPAGRSATYLDFDGTLADTDLVRVCAYYCLHAGGRRRSLGKVARLAANVPLFLALDARSRQDFASRLFGFYEGMSEDRLERLAERMHREVIAPRVRPAVREFLDLCRRQGPLVLISGATDFTVRRFAEEEGIDHVVANRLEYRDGVATGRLLPPEIFGSNKARMVREHAREHDIDLESSAAYADSVNDAAMLDAVGRGGVVNPGRKLRAMAREAGWRVVEW